MRKFNGVAKDRFHLFLKQSGPRFNNSGPKSHLKLLNQWVKEKLGQLSRVVQKNKLT